MQSLSKSVPTLLLCTLTGFFGSFTAPAQAPGGRVVLVLPFDNRSGDASVSWIADSFPDTLNKRLASAGFLTISHDDRAFAYDHHPHCAATGCKLCHHRQLQHQVGLRHGVRNAVQQRPHRHPGAGALA